MSLTQVIAALIGHVNANSLVLRRLDPDTPTPTGAEDWVPWLKRHQLDVVICGEHVSVKDGDTVRAKVLMHYHNINQIKDKSKPHTIEELCNGVFLTNLNAVVTLCRMAQQLVQLQAATVNRVQRTYNRMMLATPFVHPTEPWVELPNR
jgi:hypothetical protein